MSKSIREQFLNKEMEVNHGGKAYEFKMAKCYEGLTQQIWDDENLLVQYLREAGILHGHLHAGFKDSIICQRAKVRKVDKTGNAVTLEEQDVKEIQSKIRTFKPATLDKPSKKSRKTLDPSKMSKEELELYIAKMSDALASKIKSEE